MEQHTEEITRIATQQEINKRLELLNTVRLLCDQAVSDFKQATEDPNVTRSEVSAAFDHKQATEEQYMRLCDWLWNHTPHGFFFDHVEQRYVQR